MPKPSHRKPKKKETPFWQSTPFVVVMAAIVGSILLQWEPVAVKVDDLLGTTTSVTKRSLQQMALVDKGVPLMNQAADVWCDQQPPGTCTEPPTDEKESSRFIRIFRFSSMYSSSLSSVGSKYLRSSSLNSADKI